MPIRAHAALLPAMQLRVSPLQRTYLLLLAERQNCSVSEAVRRLIDHALDAEPPVEGGFLGGERKKPLPVRTLLELADHDNVEPDPAWLSTYGEGE
jgi:hypothetical protein